MTGSAPSPPQYLPLPAYSPPAPLAQAPNPNSVIPLAMTPLQIGQGGAQFETTLPQWLQLTNYNGTANPSAPGGQGGPFDQQLIQQAANWYMQNQVQPQVSAAQSAMQNSGQNYGSYGPAYTGQLTAQGQQQAFQAALAANQQEYQDVLAGRSSYLSGGPQVAQNQNQLDIQRGIAVENANLQNAAMANQYNLGSAGLQNNYNLQAGEYPNQFNLNNFGNQLASYQAQQQGLLGGIMGGGMLATTPIPSNSLASGLGSFFGGGGAPLGGGSGNSFIQGAADAFSNAALGAF